MQVQFLVWELRSYKLQGHKTKTQNRINIVKNPIKALKIVHIKKKKKSWGLKSILDFLAIDGDSLIYSGLCDNHRRVLAAPYVCITTPNKLF